MPSKSSAHQHRLDFEKNNCNDSAGPRGQKAVFKKVEKTFFYPDKTGVYKKMKARARINFGRRLRDQDIGHLPSSKARKKYRSTISAILNTNCADSDQLIMKFPTILADFLVS